MIQGKVIHGKAIGRLRGYPTANLDIDPKKTHLAPGVYAAYVLIDHVNYQASLIIMFEPKKVEVHILDFPKNNLYSYILDIEPIQRVSQVEKIKDESELKEKIKHDLILVRKVFEEE